MASDSSCQQSQQELYYPVWSYTLLTYMTILLQDSIKYCVRKYSFSSDMPFWTTQFSMTSAKIQMQKTYGYSFT